MKRRILIFTLSLIMLLSLMGCNSESSSDVANLSPFGIKISGKQYDLNNEFESEVAKMVKNKLTVSAVDGVAIYDVDKKGQLKTISAADSKGYDEIMEYADMQSKTAIYAYKRKENPMFPDLNIDTYDFRYVKNPDFETIDGITQNSTLADVSDLEGVYPYVNTYKMMNWDNSAYVALYIDGKVVDVSSYKETLESYKAKAEPDLSYSALGELYVDETYSDYEKINECISYTLLNDSHNFVYNADKADVLFHIDDAVIRMASAEAFHKLLNNEVSSVVLVYYLETTNTETSAIEMCPRYDIFTRKTP